VVRPKRMDHPSGPVDPSAERRCTESHQPPGEPAVWCDSLADLEQPGRSTKPGWMTDVDRLSRDGRPCLQEHEGERRDLGMASRRGFDPRDEERLSRGSIGIKRQPV